MSFALFGTNGAVSRVHCDPEGVASVIRIESGCKIWAMMLQESECDPDPSASLDNLKDWANRRWAVSLVMSGDVV